MSTPGTVNYPATLDDAVSLLEARNGATTTLSADLSAVATTANVVSTALFPSTGAITLVGVEIAYYTGKTATSFTGLIRGADGTTAVAHVSAGSVQGRIIARHHTVLSEAIIAAETKTNSVEAASVAGLAGKAAAVHTHDAGTLAGATLAANVLASSLTSVGTLATLTVTAAIVGSVTGSSGSTTGNAATATALATSRNINGVAFNGTADITVAAAAGTLTGTVLNATVVTSSLSAVGTISTGVWTGTTIAIANGGTGQTTANAALNALLPSQATHSGKVLTTDATNTSWALATDATKLPLAGGTMTGMLNANSGLHVTALNTGPTDAAITISTNVPSGLDAQIGLKFVNTGVALPYALNAFFSAQGDFASGMSVVISNKRTGVNGLIQDVGDTPVTGHEPSMLAVSPDVNGPSIGIEAFSTLTGGNNNSAAIAVYDMNDPNGIGSGAYTPGFHKKKWMISGNGTQFWGTWLKDDTPANYEAKLALAVSTSARKGLRLTTQAITPFLDFYTTDATAAARNWRIATNFTTPGTLEFLRGTSNGAEPNTPVFSLDNAGLATVTGVFAVNPGTFFSTVDSTAQFVISGTTAPAYINLNPLTNLFLRGNVVATAGATAQESVGLIFRGHRWNGSSSSGLDAHVVLRPKATITDSYLAFGFTDNNDEMLNLTHGGRVGIGLAGSGITAVLHLKAGTATAGTAPLKIDPGTVNTTAVSGCIESDGTHLYWVDSGNTRRQLDN